MDQKDNGIPAMSKPSLAENLGRIEKLPAMLAGAAAFVYLPGFIIVNAYMASKGVSEFPLLSSRYIAAGALFMVVAAIFYFFVLNKVLSRARSGIPMPSEWSGFFSGYVHNYFLLEAIFGCAHTSAWLYFLTGPSERSFACVVVTTCATGIDKAIFTSAWSAKTKFLWSGLIFFSSLAAFISLADAAMLGLFAVSAIFLNAVITVITSEGWKTGDDRIWGSTFMTIYCILATATFGAVCYGSISPKFGGGHPQPVKPILASTATKEVTQRFANVDHVLLLATTEKFTVVEISKKNGPTQVLSLNAGQFDGFLYDPIPKEPIADSAMRLLQKVFPAPPIPIEVPKASAAASAVSAASK